MQTVVHRFLQLRQADNANQSALVKYADDFTIEKTYSWIEYVNNSFGFAKFLLSLNNEKQNVAIHSFNCPEWFFSAMGTMMAGRIFTGIYNTNNTEQCMHVISTGLCGVLVVESCSLFLEKYRSVFDELVKSDVKVVIINNDLGKLQHADLNMLRKLPITMWSFWSDLETYNYQADAEFEKITNTVDLDKICTLIFTSGTTSNPKAVQITHLNINTALDGVLDRFDFVDYEERFVSYLPLSHIAGQAIDLYTPIFCKGQVHFARPDALKGSIKDTLLVVRPTIFFGVPRVWEKFRESLMEVSKKAYSGTSGWALGKFMSGVKNIERIYNTSEKSYYRSTLYPLSIVSSRIVNNIKEKLGLDKCKYFATGAAPISKEVLLYFSSIGICILELYGMSETCGVISVSDHIHSVRGSCGSPVKGVTVKIGGDDEILVKGDNIFSGYFGSNADTGIDRDGFLHTGDCGKLDEDGYLSIIGRNKELIITAGGENIPPVRIEDIIKEYVKDCKDAQAVLVGDKRKFLTLLVFTEEDDSKRVADKFYSACKKYNEVDAISNSQKVQDVSVIKEALTIENGMLTPTMKYKRSKIVEKYKNEIDSMYE